MTKAPLPSLLAAAPFLVLLAACSSEVTDADEIADFADSDPSAAAPAEISQRQDTLEGIGDSFKAIRGQLEAGTPDFTVIEASATDINRRANELEGLFPEGTGRDAGWDTEALATIWERPDEFAAAHQKLLDESATMMTVAGTGDAAAVGEQVKALGGACKNCHDDFRLDDD
ncbi:c-type cytochrome [Erythrobacter sp.]|jgi:cytochrome c556|uniref:c-type cytochrome n=1 Tax=Erythrobacter sp. TaxID=1042 RepID=UPI002ECAD7FB|nr:cytochrome c [Erythrobacter sp.]